MRQQLDKQASIVHVANDLTHYTASFRPLSPGDLLLLIDTIEVMTTRMKNDLGTIPTLDQRRAVITEVVQVSVLLGCVIVPKVFLYTSTVIFLITYTPKVSPSEKFWKKIQIYYPSKLVEVLHYKYSKRFR